MTKISGSEATYGTTTAIGVTLGDLATKMAMLGFIALLFLTLCHKDPSPRMPVASFVEN